MRELTTAASNADLVERWKRERDQILEEADTTASENVAAQHHLDPGDLDDLLVEAGEL